jgi:hypothetical protein
MVEICVKNHNPNPMQAEVYCMVSQMSMKYRSKTSTLILSASLMKKPKK